MSETSTQRGSLALRLIAATTDKPKYPQLWLLAAWSGSARRTVPLRALTVIPVILGPVKTAISLPDKDFERFERIAARNGMSRSEFYRRAGAKLADELEGSSSLTLIAQDVLTRVGQPAEDGLLLEENRRVIESGSEW